MSTFRIGFLLAFSLHSNSPTKKKSDKRKHKDIEKASKSKKHKKEKEPLVVPKYVLDVGSPVGYGHIEYDLIPGVKQKLQIDIICWNGVAKIFAGDEVLTYRVKVINETVWVPVFLQHFMNQLDAEELIKLHQHEINFTIFTNKTKLGSKAKGEKTKLFYLKEEDIDLDSIAVPVYDKNPNFPDVTKTSSSIHYIEDILKECVYNTFYRNTKEIVTAIKISDTVQTIRMIKLISSVLSSQDTLLKEFIAVSSPFMTPRNELPQEDVNVKSKQTKKQVASKKHSTQQKKKETKQNKSKKNMQMQIKIPGEIFFTDPDISIHDLSEGNEVIVNAYVLLSVEKLMTIKQKFILNPLIIKIEKIENLDVELLKSKQFKSIFMRYNIPHIAQARTYEREIAEKIRFHESHAHFTHTVPKVNFTEFIQTKKFVVEICGVRERGAKPEVKANIFGSQYNDQYIDRKMTPNACISNLQNKLEESYSPVEVLAVASYDLTSLLIPSRSFWSKETCHHPDSIFFREYCPTNSNEPNTTNNINLKVLTKPKSNSPLTESSLIQKGTSLKINVSFAAPATMITKKVYRGNCYNRILLILYNSNLAAELLNEILICNHVITTGVVVPSLTKNAYYDPDLEEERMTGFVIDNFNTFTFFLEGIYDHELQKVWLKFMKKSPNDMTIYFNSDFVFEERFYGSFFKYGGLCVITLQKPLKDILAQTMFYLQGNVPLPCWEAVKKLDLLLRCTTMKDMLQNNLLPTPDELLSLNLEWGVPMRWNKSLLHQIL